MQLMVEQNTFLFLVVGLCLVCLSVRSSNVKLLMELQPLQKWMFSEHSGDPTEIATLKGV